MAKRKKRFEALHVAIAKGLAEFHRRRISPYDGLLGSLPDWIPQELVQRFEVARDFLLDRYSEPDVRSWIAARAARASATRRALGPPPDIDLEPEDQLGTPWPPGIAPAAGPRIDILIWTHEIIRLGPDRGLTCYLGEDQDTRYRGLVNRRSQQARAQRPRRAHPADAVIEKHFRANPRATWKEIRRDAAKGDPEVARKINKDRVSRVRRRLADSH